VQVDANIAVFALFLMGCGPAGPSRPPIPPQSDFEVPELAVVGHAAAAFRLARGDEEARATLQALPPRKTLLCAWTEGRPTCGQGDGDNLAESVTNAAKAMGPALGRLELAWVVSEAQSQLPVLGFSFDYQLAGVEGYAIESGGHRSFLLPSEVLTQGAFYGKIDDKGAMRPHVLISKLQQRAPGLTVAARAPTVKFRATTWVEGLQPTDPPIRTYRAHPFDPPVLTPELLQQRVVYALEHLAQITDDQGLIRYVYDPVERRPTKSYNWLRHAGTVYSVCAGYARTHHGAYLAAGTAATARMLEESKIDPRGRYIPSRNYIKLGGAGLSLVALTQCMEATGDRANLGQAREFATFVVSQQKPDGEFFSYAPLTIGEARKDGVSEYYPGEAILGLARLAVLDPNPDWREAAIRGADWLIDVRDAGKGPDTLANDHWLMIALSYLYEQTRDPRYLNHSLKLARAVEVQYEANRGTWAQFPDWRGGYYRPPRSTPAATRGEGLVAVLDTCKLASANCEFITPILHDTVRHELAAQYTPEMTWWMVEPQEAVGGFAGGLVSLGIRNDFVQHNLSSILGAERHLLAKSGTIVPGGPVWSRRAAIGSTFNGLEPQTLQTYRSPLVGLRGLSRWEKPQ
jgi:hypothetical protein